ncbi:MAG: RluA family pseudouridine synthase [Alphaproteobacteria bacterium]|nr:RluA family pseudouridine synthase [Alphaproteobacteria bacterium]
MTDNIKTFTVADTDAGVRLDKFLSLQMPEFSRNEIQKFVIRDSLLVTRKLKLSDKVKIGEEYSVTIPERTTYHISPVTCHDKMPLDILYEDDDIIVINKPRGISMYPGAGRDSGTLVQGILAHTNLSELGGDTRPGVVHRLDKDTSGVVIFAKSDAAYRVLTKTFAAHDLTRKYIAFVWGVPNWESADITGNIGRGTRNRQKMTMLKVGGKEAKTSATVINAWPRNNVSELRCTLFTGRTHQIRVHLSSHGFPVLCDPLYGRGNTRLGSVKNPELLEFIKTHHGQMLHAEILELNHPVTNAPLKFRAKLPDDMRELKEILS